MSSENLGKCSGRQLPFFCSVSACDPELRVFPPGRVNLQRNQEPRRGWISILEPLRGATLEYPQWECVHRASFPALSLGSHLLGAHFLPYCPLASDSEVRPGQPLGRGTAEGVPKARQGSEGKSPSIPGAPPACSLGLSLLLLPDPGASPQTPFVQLSPCHLPSRSARVSGH